MTSHVLVVGGWSEVLLDALGAADAVSYIGATDASPSFDPVILTRCAHVVTCRLVDLDALVLGAVEVHERLAVTRVVCQTEYGLVAAATAALALGVPGPELLPVLRTRHKDALRTLLAGRGSGVDVPHASVRNRTDLEAFVDVQGLPIIIKPPDGFAAIGVRQIREPGELSALLAGWTDGASPLLAEELIDSDDIFSVETQSAGAVHETVGFSYSRLVGYPQALFNYTIVPPPAHKLPLAVADRAERMACTVLDGVKLTHGSAHTEFKLRPDGAPALIESQTRVGGDRIWRMVAETAGVSQIAADCRGALTGVPHPRDRGTSVARGFYSFMPPAGPLVDIQGLADLSADSAVLAVDVAADLMTAGVPDIRDNTQRPVQVLLAAVDHEQLWADLRRVTSAVTFVYANGMRWTAQLPDQPYP